VTRAQDLAHGVPALLLVLLLSAGSAAAQGEPVEGAADPVCAVLAADVGAVYGGDERVVETLEQKGGRIG